MRHLKSYITRVSNEDASTDDVVAATPEAEPVPAANAVIEATTLIEETPTSDDFSADLAEVTDIQESLENFKVLVDASFARGGMRPEEGLIFHTGLEHFQRRLGLVQTKLGLEDFGGNMSRLKATKVSQEALDDTIKALGDKIRKLIKIIYDAVTKAVLALDVQAEKVNKLTLNAKQRLINFALQEITYEDTRPTLISSEDIEDMCKLTIAGAATSHEIMSDLMVSITAIKGSITRLIASDGGEEDIADFHKRIADEWVGNHPFIKVLGSKHGYNVSSVRGFALIKATEDERNPLKAASLKIGTAVHEGSIKCQFHKAKFIRFTDAVETVNKATIRLTKDFTTVNRMAADMAKLTDRAPTPEAGKAIYDAIISLTDLLNTQVRSMVDLVSMVRGQYGYVLAKLTEAFSK